MLRATCCVICGRPLPAGSRLDRRYCRKSCRAVAYRAGKREPTSRSAQRATPPGDGEVERTLLYTRIPREVLDVLARNFGQQRERLVAELAATRQRLAELEGVISSEPAKAAAAAIDDQRGLQAEVSRLKSELATTRDTLTTQFETAQRQRRELAATLREVTSERDEALRDLGIEAARADALEAKDREEVVEPEAPSPDSSAALLESLQVRFRDLSAENERLKDALIARSNLRDAELSEAIERRQALEQEKAAWENLRMSMALGLAEKEAAVVTAEHRASEQAKLSAALTIKLRNAASNDSIAGATIAELREEIAQLRRTLSKVKKERDEALEENEELSENFRPTKEKKSKPDDTQGELKRALAERDAARAEARAARAELKKGEEQLTEKARQLVEKIERNKAPQNAFTLAAHRYEGPYVPSNDRLYRAKLEELLQTAELAHHQYVQSKPQTARTLNPHMTPQQQAYALAMAERWWLLADPPKSYKHRVSWAQEGYVLDPEAELYLYKHSHDRRADAWWRALWLKPNEPKRRRR